MELAMELENDLFYADLSKQISLLIMDDDEDPVAHCPSVSFQAFSRTCHPTAPSPIMYEQACRRQSQGTGVFIPRSSLPRRKNRQGKSASLNNKSYRQPDKPRSVSNITYTNEPSSNFSTSKNC
ncbi:hypothetical protein FRX31_016498 [Thalictrum thalictroides]|uniref:Uncharacterized protein n=1 Tax=Thalictrum thalictroides TaxID=46969 RepID=A0A7J6WC06_THATH|nr:hypothetical protein FRX31_016498 [Thalictrum thalictroides]